MDEHRRHICKEPGCKNIIGFLYIGGLLRHRREVHHEHTSYGSPPARPDDGSRDNSVPIGTSHSTSTLNGSAGVRNAQNDLSLPKQAHGDLRHQPHESDTQQAHDSYASQASSVDSECRAGQTLG
ncbi:hypothetical protein MMC28_006609 [Mycoblastus sanguinarius]|nr:hypothetical protein [Mycoblastus sanguinarius]